MSFAAGQAAFAASLLRPGSPSPAGVTTARGGPDAARFAVYRNNVFVGLTRGLAQRFPVTERLVGADFFRGMARAFAEDHRPASPLLFAYGDDFPDFIAGFPPAAGVPYLADVARLEASWTDAYYAADAASLDPAALAGLAPDVLATARLVPHPATRLVRSQYPVGSIWAAHRGDALAPPPGWRPEATLVTRPEMAVRVHVLPTSHAGFATALLAGVPLIQAAETASCDPGFDFGPALVGLVSLGAFRAIHHGGATQ